MTTFLTNHDEIHEWLAKYCNIKGNIFISDDGQVTIDGDLILNSDAETEITHFAVRFNEVSGYFNCSRCDLLVSLEGAPLYVGGNFSCARCTALTSLAGAPLSIGGAFYCSACSSLENLRGAPTIVGNDFYCYACPKLTTLEGSPQQVGGHFHCNACPSLRSLVGVTPVIPLNFSCCNCPQLIDLQDGPVHVGRCMDISNCSSLATLFGCPAVIETALVANACPALTSYACVGDIHVLRVDACCAISPDSCRVLLQHKVKLDVERAPPTLNPLIQLVNAYNQTGDLITAIAAFEAYFGEPFHATIVAIPTNVELPSL